jgi:hypothetical protein
LTIGSDSKAAVLGTSTDFGFGNIKAASTQKGLRAALAKAQPQWKAGSTIFDV